MILAAETFTTTELTQLAIKTISTLSIDAVQQAQPRHTGMPIAPAPLMYTISNRAMRFDPQDPIWPKCDRFVLSSGHASMLLWSMSHLTCTQAVNAGYERLGYASVALDDIRPSLPDFRLPDSLSGRPTLIILDSHIGDGLPHKQYSAKSTASRWAGKSAGRPSTPDGRKKRSPSCRTACMSTSKRKSEPAARRRVASGASNFMGTARRIPKSPPGWSSCTGASCHPARIGIRLCSPLAKELLGKR